jgi:fructose-bisphosphate aldolase class II
MHHLRQILKRAEENGVAVGHFNVSDLVFIKSVSSAARQLNVPVIVGASKGERDFLGLRELAAIIVTIRQESDFPVFLNSDHTHSLAEATEAAKAGFDVVSFDASSLPFDQNVRATREAVDALKTINPDILVEGEIGNIGSGSQIHDKSPDLSTGLSTPAEAKEFVASTSVDMLAPAVGNMHGMLKSMVRGETKKRLDIERIVQIKEAALVPLTLHGGSGTSDADLTKAIAAGINIIHINTELRVAWRRSLEDALASDSEQVVPYKILSSPVEAVMRVVLSRLRLFNRLPSTQDSANKQNGASDSKNV